MERALIRTCTILATAVAFTTLLTGCPIPIPAGYTEQSRETLGDDVAGKLEAGISTREDVLLLLGEPDDVGPGETWLTYDSVYGQAGVLFIFCAASTCGGMEVQKMEHKRLLIIFDRQGLLTSASFINKDCWTVNGENNPAGLPPCLEMDPRAEQLAKPIEHIQPLVTRDLREFANGKAKLIKPGWASGFSEAVASGSNSALIKNLYGNGQWDSLARLIISIGYGDNLGWYYLGRAAEGLALCDAALIYYGISRERTQHFSTRCLGPACYGVKFPDELDRRMFAVETMRATGQCATPPEFDP